MPGCYVVSVIATYVDDVPTVVPRTTQRKHTLFQTLAYCVKLTCPAKATPPPQDKTFGCVILGGQMLSVTDDNE